MSQNVSTQQNSNSFPWYVCALPVAGAIGGDGLGRALAEHKNIGIKTQYFKDKNIALKTGLEYDTFLNIKDTVKNIENNETKAAWTKMLNAMENVGNSVELLPAEHMALREKNLLNKYIDATDKSKVLNEIKAIVGDEVGVKGRKKNVEEVMENLAKEFKTQSQNLTDDVLSKCKLASPRINAYIGIVVGALAGLGLASLFVTNNNTTK